MVRLRTAGPDDKYQRLGVEKRNVTSFKCSACDCALPGIAGRASSHPVRPLSLLRPGDEGRGHRQRRTMCGVALFMAADDDPIFVTPTNTSYSTTSIDSCSSAKTTASSSSWYKDGADGADAIAREWVLHNKDIGIDIELITDPNYSSRVASEPRAIYWGLKNSVALTPASAAARHHSNPGEYLLFGCAAPFGRRRLEGASKRRRSR
jgi:hypothetical protein